MAGDFRQVTWDESTADDCRQIIRLAVREDLDCGHDLTTMALVAPAATGAADIVARRGGVVAGLSAIPVVLDELNVRVEWHPRAADGHRVESGAVLGTLRGLTRDLLTSERILLNLLGRLSGVATLTRRFVDAIAGTKARIYDTRKTTPGWRRLEKYAVRCGGGRNHRTGLYDAVLIKDNHLAQAASAGEGGLGPAEAVARARSFLREYYAGQSHDAVLLEVEVDTYAQFLDALTAQPDIILLDNMSAEQLRQCVAARDAAGSVVELEASGGIQSDNVRAVAESGVERISLGALTHSAVSLDVALDWDFT
ncbi:MAG: carboxylating nicotinate-nucleotide diphosphorylase [Pirellulaceae bacterium]